ncbi:MAG TPA: CHASE3 domain-containing protein [Pyrinomonadaceae bacterium]|jgi:PAS domain S-box-containing protein
MFYTLERQISIILLVAILILIGIGGFAFYNSHLLHESLKWEKHTQEVLLELDETLLFTVEAETDARGFIITGREDFMESYNASRSKTIENLPQLKKLIDDNPEQITRTETLETQISEKINYLDQAVRMRQSEGREAVIAAMGNGQGKALMDKVRQTAQEIKNEENGLLKQRENELNQNLERAFKFLLSSIVIGILMLGLAEFVVLREIGKRQRAETQLKEANKDLEKRVAERTKQLSESELFSRTILNSLSANIAVLDKKGNIVTVNDAWEDFAKSNAGAQQLSKTGVGENYLAVCGSDSDETLKSIAEQLKAVLDRKSDGFSLEYPCHSPDTQRWFLMQVSPFHVATGGAVVSHIDITDRKKAETELAASEEFNRSIVENSPDCVKVLELDGNMISMNYPGMCLMEIDDFMPFRGQQWTNNWEGEYNRLAREAVEKAKRGESAFFQGFACTAKGTPKWWDVTVAPVRDANGKVSRLLVNSRDITERKQAERELEKLLLSEQSARREAEIANRLRDEFMATVSHELRTPLNAILGWARLLKQGKLNEEVSRKAVETIIRSSETQNRLIEDLLDMAKIVSGKLHLEKIEIAPDDLINNALATVKPSVDAKSIKVNLNSDGNRDEKKISGDPNRLQQIIWNLLANAIKFTPEGGVIDVDLTTDNGFAEIKITDNGIGIKSEFLPFVFERFRQDAANISRSGGLGLGLAIVRHLTEMHGGTVSAASDGENKGSTFTVKLPTVSGNGKI